MRELLGYPESHTHHNVSGNGKRDGLKSCVDWTISRQAPRGRGEGSTTNAYGPERIMKRHECATRKGRYSLVSDESSSAVKLKKPQQHKRPYTGKLDDLSEQPVKEIIRKVLKNDAKEAIDTLAYAEFADAPLRATATTSTAITVTTDGATPSVTNDNALEDSHVKLIIDEMKERNIPPYAHDDYYAIAWPSTFRTFKDDLEDKAIYTETGFTHIMNGEIGRYEGCRFVEQTHIAKEGWTNSKSDWCYFMGEDTVAEAIAIPEEIRGKIPTDYREAA